MCHTLQSCWLFPARKPFQLTQSQRLIWIRVLQQLPSQALGLVHNAAVVPRQGMQREGLIGGCGGRRWRVQAHIVCSCQSVIYAALHTQNKLSGTAACAHMHIITPTLS